MLACVSRYVLPPLVIAAALLVYRVVGVGREPERTAFVPPPSNTPRLIVPQTIEPRVATDDQLRQVLEKVKPPAAVHNSAWVHALRLWGPQAEFASAETPSGRKLLNFFLDDNVFQQVVGSNAEPLFTLDIDGVRIRDFDEDFNHRLTSSFHAEDILATFAEVGVPLDTPIVARNGQATVRDLLAASMRRYHPDRFEFEWSTIAYGRYLFPVKEWRNRHDEKIDIGSWFQRCTERPGAGPCKGQHRFEALVVLLQADAQQPTLSPASRKAFVGFLQSATKQLVAAQAADGSWSAKWLKGEAGRDDKEASLDERMLVTGHTLEWLALAPPEAQPPRETVVRAGQWIANTLVGLDDTRLSERYGPYSHAARALCLWRGQEAWPLWQSLNEQPAEQAAE